MATDTRVKVPRRWEFLRAGMEYRNLMNEMGAKARISEKNLNKLALARKALTLAALALEED